MIRKVLLAALAAAAFGLMAVPATASHTCAPMYTFNLHGTNGADEFDKSNANKNFCVDMKNGDDLWWGNLDNVPGENQRDLINAGGGADGVESGEGDDEVNGGDGHDTLLGGWGVDIVRGQNGNDWISGVDITAPNGDTVEDKLYGGPGADYITTGTTVGYGDLISDGDGVDTIVGDSVSDVFCRTPDGLNDDTSNFDGAIYNDDHLFCTGL